ncbi:MAG: hypothetical protein J0H01_12300 [Rhizobiales bacterium]|nr:hypothetical protein [Hyphomicrobiales bacterium]
MKFAVALAAAFVLFASARESQAISLGDCAVPRGNQLVNICTQDITVWYRLCNGQVGRSRLRGGGSEFNSSQRCGPQILHVCPMAQADIGQCRFGGA